MFDFDYPKVKQSLGQAALQDPYPAWLLDSRGVIHAANLMAFWLWDTIRPGEPVKPDSLLGISVFNILADNLERIPVDQNVDFYMKRSAVVKRIDANLRSPLYASFIGAMKANPRMAQIYDYTIPNLDREWEYPLRIALPGLKGSTRFLEFQVTHYRLEGDVGSLVMYSPTPATLPVIEEQYSLLVSKCGEKVYALPDNMEQDNVESNQLPTNLPGFSRSYYPTLIQDSLWYLIGENRAHLLLMGESVVGRHFFELFFAPQLREWLGPLQETSAPRAIKYFDTFTANFLREDHELHAAYEQVMKQLLQLPDFRNLLAISRKLPIHINLPQNTGAPFYTCRVILPWPLSHKIALQFRSMVRLIHKGLLTYTDRPNYEITLVPENYETEVALILLHLFSTATLLDDIGHTALKQFLWGLAIMKTVQEGLSRKDGGNMQWGPEDAFASIHNELDAEFSNLTEDTIDEFIAELRVIIEALDRKGIVDKEVLLTMLESFTLTKMYLDQLSNFFTTELEIHKRVEEVSREASKKSCNSSGFLSS